MSKQAVWIVVDEESFETRPDGAKSLRRVLIAASEEQAVEWVDQRPDKAKVERGGYGIDGPCELPLELR